MIARYLETAGMPTVVMGCAKDIVEQAGVPRFWWSDFPLGHSAGKPHDLESQDATLRGALALFDHAAQPRTTVQSPQVWASDDRWKQDFMRIDHLDAEALDKLRQDHESHRASKPKQAT